MEEKQKKKKTVKDRWYRYRYRTRQPAPRILKIQPQFTLEELYIPPFAYERRRDEQGREYYLPIDVNRNPTGIRLLDLLAQQLTDRTLDVGKFCKQAGLRYADLDGFIFALTGMSGADFRVAYQVRTADDLLRYTDMSIVDVASRSGCGSRVNLYYAFIRNTGTTPTDRRKQLRQDDDLGRYRLTL